MDDDSVQYSEPDATYRRETPRVGGIVVWTMRLSQGLIRTERQATIALSVAVISMILLSLFVLARSKPNLGTPPPWGWGSNPAYKPAP